VHRGDHWFEQIETRSDAAEAAFAERRRSRRAVLRGVFQVIAGGERFLAGAGDHGNPGVRVLGEIVEGRRQLRVCRWMEGIHYLGTVDGDARDAPLFLIFDELVRHSSLLGTLSVQTERAGHAYTKPARKQKATLHADPSLISVPPLPGLSIFSRDAPRYAANCSMRGQEEAATCILGMIEKMAATRGERIRCLIFKAFLRSSQAGRVLSAAVSRDRPHLSTLPTKAGPGEADCFSQCTPLPICSE